jgi:predicted glycoside hydrolase/deacetylase ChbG (UPF0249 family)
MLITRRLIINADDFGQSTGVTAGILAAHDGGVVTSASLMARWPGAAAAAEAARCRPRLSVGLHVDFGEWALRGGEWVPVYEVVPTGDRAAVADEVARQLAIFRLLMGQEPTHLDSHQHVHRREHVLSVLSAVARELNVPLRHFSPEVRYCGDFYGQDADGSPLPGVISVEGLERILASLPAGWTEMACHPGDASDLDTMYREERRQELRILCDPRIREAIRTAGIELCSFSELGRGRRTTEE